MKKDTCWDSVVLGGIFVIGAAEAAHLAAVLLKWPFSRCCILFWVLAAVALACLAALRVGRGRRRKNLAKSRRAEDLSSSPEPPAHARLTMETAAVWALFAALALSQAVYLCMKDNGVRQGDIMPETVESFLSTNRVYQVNPMTGQAYTEGIPMRLKILCLPFLYSSICKLTGLGAGIVVRILVPLLVLAACYGAFAALGSSLCRERGMGLACFMAAAALLVWAGAGMEGMDGYRLLQGGWQGVTIRNCVLMPWLVSLCIRKKWLYVPLCVLAEACIAWTLYGMGICLAAAGVMALIQVTLSFRPAARRP